MNTLKEAVLYTKLDSQRVKCVACPRYCKLSDGQIGFCGVRKNIDGKLFLLVYGKVIAVHIDPIEKKPFSHFMPGSKAFSIGTVGCDWACEYCQNFDISQRRRVSGSDAPPERVVESALRYGANGIAYTYNEPTIFIEYAHDIGVLARKNGLYNVFVSNGYSTPEATEMMLEFLDAITVDFKGNGEEKFLQRYAYVPNPEPIYENLVTLKNGGLHVEITDLVVPKVGDNVEAARKLCRWVLENLGDETPLHFLRFHPDYKMLNLPSTPIDTLERHYKIAKDVGLKYVYLGNVPGHLYENTYCPRCGKIVIKRYGFEIFEWHLNEDNKCSFCGNAIPIRGRFNKRAVSRDRFYSIESF